MGRLIGISFGLPPADTFLLVERPSRLDEDEPRLNVRPRALYSSSAAGGKDGADENVGDVALLAGWLEDGEELLEDSEVVLDRAFKIDLPGAGAERVGDPTDCGGLDTKIVAAGDGIVTPTEPGMLLLGAPE